MVGNACSNVVSGKILIEIYKVQMRDFSSISVMSLLLLCNVLAGFDVVLCLTPYNSIFPKFINYTQDCKLRFSSVKILGIFAKMG